MKKYSDNYLWFEDKNEYYEVGITKEGYEAVGAVLWLENSLPIPYHSGETVVTLETNKSVIEVTAPMDINIIENNGSCVVGNSEDWIFRVSPECDVSRLMDEAEYRRYLHEK